MWEVSLDSEIPVVLSRANYDRTRSNFYRLTGMARNDDLLPKLVPPNGIVARKITGVAPGGPVGGNAGGVVMPPIGSYLYPTIVWPDSFIELAPGGASARVPGFILTLADPASDRVLEVTNPAYPLYTTIDHGSDDWWYDTPWGQEVVALWTPLLVRGQFGWEFAQATALATDDPAIPNLVAVRFPHPYIVGLPEPEARVAGHSVNDPEPSGGLGHPVGLFRSPVIYTGRGDRQGPKFYTAWAPPGIVGWWQGHYADVEGHEWWQDALEYGTQSLARSAALQMLVTAVGSAVSFGAGGVFVQALIQSGVVQGLQASPLGALSEKLGASMIPSGSPTQPGAVDLLHPQSPGELFVESANPVHDVGATATPLEAAAQAPAATLAVGAPDASNKILASAAEVSVYLDSLGAVAELYNMELRELTIRAQRTQAAADTLRVKLAVMEAEVHEQPWYQAVKATIMVTQAVVLGVNALAEAGAEGVEAFGVTASQAMNVAKFGLTAAKTVLNLLNSAELMRIVADRLEAQNAAHGIIAGQGAVDAALAHMATATPAMPAAGRSWLVPVLAIVGGGIIGGPVGAIVGGVAGWLVNRRRA